MCHRIGGALYGSDQYDDINQGGGRFERQDRRRDLARIRVSAAQVRAARITDPDRAGDVHGEILLRIHTHLDRVSDDEHLTRWVYRIARNAIIDEYRRAARERARLEPLSANEAESAERFPADDQPEVLRELASCLSPLLDGLSPEQRRAVELADLEGVTQVEAAGIEGISLSGMKSRVQRGRRRLVELLKQCCELTLDARGMPMDYTAPPDCRCGTDGG